MLWYTAVQIKIQIMTGRMVKLSSCSVDTLYSLTLQCDKFNQKIQQHFCIGFVTVTYF